MAKKPNLKLGDRLEIKILLDKGYSFRAISEVMDRGHNTVSYEVNMNGGKDGYNPYNADQYARTRKKDTRHQWSKIEANSELKAYIIEKLEAHWNPDEIAGRMKKDKTGWYASKTAIYEWLWSVQGQAYCVHLYSKRYQKKKRKKKTERVMIPDRVSIHHRSKTVDNRRTFGHWEYDTVVSRKGCSGGLSVGSERKGKLITATVVKSMSTVEHMEVIQKCMTEHPTLSVTFDNGIENKQHKALGVPTFFCDPYCSAQKGGVENANKMLRRYFPKGTNFRKVTQKQVDTAVLLINSKPRKSLGYKTALEVSRVWYDRYIKSKSVLIEG